LTILIWKLQTETILIRRKNRQTVSIYYFRFAIYNLKQPYCHRGHREKQFNADGDGQLVKMGQFLLKKRFNFLELCG